MSVDESASESAAAEHWDKRCRARTDPEVSARPIRRKFSAEDKRQIVQDAAGCRPGEARCCGAKGCAPPTWPNGETRSRKRRLRRLRSRSADRSRSSPIPLAQPVAELECEIDRLEGKLAKAEAIIKVQKRKPQRPRGWIPQRKARPSDLSHGGAGTGDRGRGGPSWRTVSRCIADGRPGRCQALARNRLVP